MERCEPMPTREFIFQHFLDMQWYYLAMTLAWFAVGLFQRHDTKTPKFLMRMVFRNSAYAFVLICVFPPLTKNVQEELGRDFLYTFATFFFLSMTAAIPGAHCGRRSLRKNSRHPEARITLAI
jgi:hypothetical protein